MLTKINQDKSLTEGGEESPVDDGGRNIAYEKENKASQNLTSVEDDITVVLKNMNERLWEEFLKWVKKHIESEGIETTTDRGEALRA
jgi:gas vesicle protein